jgi:hypothetical protein
VAKDKEPAQAPLTAWGDTKKCPACGEKIKSIALRCRYCGEDFNTVDPLTARDLRGQAELEEDVQKLQTGVTVLFVLSVLGFLAPIIFPTSLAVVLLKRKPLARAGPFYVALGYSAIAVSGVFSLLMVLFLVFGSLLSRS